MVWPAHTTLPGYQIRGTRHRAHGEREAGPQTGRTKQVCIAAWEIWGGQVTVLWQKCEQRRISALSANIVMGPNTMGHRHTKHWTRVLILSPIPTHIRSHSAPLPNFRPSPPHHPPSKPTHALSFNLQCCCGKKCCSIPCLVQTQARQRLEPISHNSTDLPSQATVASWATGRSAFHRG